MSYDDEFRHVATDALRYCLTDESEILPDRAYEIASLAVSDFLSLLKPLTLKTEDGRLVEMERVGFDPGGCPLYREKWEAPDA